MLERTMVIDIRKLVMSRSQRSTKRIIGAWMGGSCRMILAPLRKLAHISTWSFSRTGGQQRETVISSRSSLNHRVCREENQAQNHQSLEKLNFLLKEAKISGAACITQITIRIEEESVPEGEAGIDRVGVNAPTSGHEYIVQHKWSARVTHLPESGYRRVRIMQQNSAELQQPPNKVETTSNDLKRHEIF